ncbi:YceI family protein [candidate division KSB1 bacterium]|nr:YceI family protein [candidate division KSB1 bacterium]
MINRILIFVFFITGVCISAEYHIDREKTNSVRFISEAPVEQIEGVTDAIDGYILWEKNNPLDKSEFYFQVDLNTIDTGIELRNRHMRENYLETEKFQYAIYKGNVTSVDTLNDGETLNVIVKGMFNLHGIDQQYEIAGSVSKEGKTLKVSSDFEISLSGHKITIPKLMFLKISEIIHIELDFYLIKQD